MSQHRFFNIDGREVVYGLDKATGGYFWQEYLRVDEITPENSEELYREAEGLSLTALMAVLENRFNADIDYHDLITDFHHSPHPTQLQINVGKAFGKDIISMLHEVEMDVVGWMMRRKDKNEEE